MPIERRIPEESEAGITAALSPFHRYVAACGSAGVSLFSDRGDSFDRDQSWRCVAAWGGGSGPAL
jgi:hypothetical protein